eukprot:scaffold5694_cov81-Skeletonema_marinoi.AAC.1
MSLEYEAIPEFGGKIVHVETIYYFIIEPKFRTLAAIALFEGLSMMRGSINERSMQTLVDASSVTFDSTATAPSSGGVLDAVSSALSFTGGTTAATSSTSRDAVGGTSFRSK